MTTLTYLSMDELGAGVGASQVLPYVERLAGRGLDVTVHSFEPRAEDEGVAARLARAGVRWERHDFGRPGAAGGLGRVLRLATALRRGGHELVHARSDLAAAAAMLGGADRWVWDVRSFWADQRIELGMLRAGSPEERLLRVIERQAARRCDGVVTLAAAALPVLGERHGDHVLRHTAVVPTCVDLEVFRPAPLPPPEPVRHLLSGSLNRYYDVATMLRLVERHRARRPVALHVLAPGTTPWDAELAAAGATRGRATPAEVPAAVAAAHVGLSICDPTAGVSLRAAMPTKLAEFLAVGRPVVVNAGLGDMDALLADHRCGVVVGGTDDTAVDAALDELDALLADPATPERCRALAEQHFDVDRGVDALVALYDRL